MARKVTRPRSIAGVIQSHGLRASSGKAIDIGMAMTIYGHDACGNPVEVESPGPALRGGGAAYREAWPSEQ